MGEAGPRSSAHRSPQQKQSRPTRARTNRRTGSDVVFGFGHEGRQTASQEIRAKMAPSRSLDVAELPLLLRRAKLKQKSTKQRLEAERRERRYQNACILPCAPQSAATTSRSKPPRAERQISRTLRRCGLAFRDFQSKSVQRALRKGSAAAIARAFLAAQCVLRRPGGRLRRWPVEPRGRTPGERMADRIQQLSPT